MLKLLHVRAFSRLQSHVSSPCGMQLCRNDFFLVTDLSLCRGGPIFSHFSLRAVGDYCSFLVNLDLSRCCHLSSLNLCHIVDNNFKTLEKLNLSDCTCIDDTGVREVVSRCLRLKQLELRQLPLLTGENCFEHIPSPGLEWLGHLDLSYCDGITPVGFCSLFPKVKHLVFLDLSFCRQLTAPSVLQLTMHCDKLESLYLKMCDHLILDGVRPAVVQSLEEKRDKFMRIADSLRQDEQPKTPAQQLLDLQAAKRHMEEKERRAEENSYLLHGGGGEPSSSVPPLSQTPLVQDEAGIPPSLTIQGRILTSQEFRSLRDLEKQEEACGSVEESGEIDPGMSVDEHRRIPAEPQIDNEPMNSLTRRLYKLYVLDLTGCKDLSSEVLGRVIKSAFRVQRLCLNQCLGLDADLLAAIGRNCKNLAWVELNRCPDLPLAAFGSLLDGLRFLRRLEIVSSSFSAEDIDWLQRKNPDVEIINFGVPTMPVRLVAKQKAPPKKVGKKGKKGKKGAARRK